MIDTWVKYVGFIGYKERGKLHKAIGWDVYGLLSFCYLLTVHKTHKTDKKN